MSMQPIIGPVVQATIPEELVPFIVRLVGDELHAAQLHIPADRIFELRDWVGELREAGQALRMSTSANGSRHRKSPASTSPEWLTAQDVATELELDPRTVTGYAATRRVSATKVGGRWMFPPSAVNAIRRIGETVDRRRR